MEEPVTISRSRRKREMLALQDLGQELVALSVHRLSQIDLPAPLLEAVLAAKRMSKFGAIRRQMQYVGRVMREIDAAPIRARLDAWSGASAADNGRLYLIERWRKRLVEEEGALADLLGEFPQADSRRLRSLCRGVKHESETGKPPRSSRALFRELREILGETEPLAAEGATDGLDPAAAATLDDELR